MSGPGGGNGVGDGGGVGIGICAAARVAKRRPSATEIQKRVRINASFRTRIGRRRLGLLTHGALRAKKGKTRGNPAMAPVSEEAMEDL
jgi:hypothetical protein